MEIKIQCKDPDTYEAIEAVLSDVAPNKGWIRLSVEGKSYLLNSDELRRAVKVI